MEFYEKLLALCLQIKEMRMSRNIIPLFGFKEKRERTRITRKKERKEEYKKEN